MSNEDFSRVVQDARAWEKLGNIESEITLGRENRDFLFGIATCTYQDSGSVHCPSSQWASWEKNLPEHNHSGKSADLFEYYKIEGGCEKITSALRELGVNSLSFDKKLKEGAQVYTRIIRTWERNTQIAPESIS